ncbi:hypothetical protein GOP47_0029010 [Adiantum capillus-veneris]|nr:hypothetical protein GOP47_0029010 [Adiantum capillus-veneris]
MVLLMHEAGNDGDNVHPFAGLLASEARKEETRGAIEEVSSLLRTVLTSGHLHCFSPTQTPYDPHSCGK